jgi:uncharacterized protein (DUF2249 family)
MPTTITGPAYETFPTSYPTIQTGPAIYEAYSSYPVGMQTTGPVSGPLFDGYTTTTYPTVQPTATSAFSAVPFQQQPAVVTTASPMYSSMQFQQPIVSASPAGFDLMKACRDQHPHLFNEFGQLKEGDAFVQAISQAGMPQAMQLQQQQQYQQQQQQQYQQQQQQQYQQQQMLQSLPQPHTQMYPATSQAQQLSPSKPFDLEASRRIANQ